LVFKWQNYTFSNVFSGSVFSGCRFSYLYSVKEVTPNSKIRMKATVFFNLASCGVTVSMPGVDSYAGID
jgi:hypothetical protein